MTSRNAAANRGVTLLELLIVLMILSLILTAAVKTWDVTLERGRYESTRKKLDQIATAIAGDANYIVAGRRADFGFVGDMGRLPYDLTELVNQPPASPPESSRWRGPYLRASFSESPETYRTDGWGDTVTYRPDSAFVRSFGGRGLVDRTRWMTRSLGFTRSELERNVVTGQIIDVRGMPPDPGVDSIGLLSVILLRPFEGVTRRDSVRVTALDNGMFYFDNIPQGNNTLVARFVKYVPPPPETTLATTNVTVYPRLGARDVRVRLNLDWNQLP
jgi:prepilin-type N-terminal cleavage/methylation domain-containing protein